MNDQITIRGARLHNLKNISLSIPKNRLVIFTGLSGSGKSTLGLDILHKEGQRQYMESLGMITFGISKPPLDSITGLSPSISIDQHLTNHSPRSTVGTVTDVYTYLRVLFARLGHRPCPACGRDVPPEASFSDSDWESETAADDDIPEEAAFPCPHCGEPIPRIGMANFSFNKPAGACETCTGLGNVHSANLTLLVDEEKSIREGAIKTWDAFYLDYYGSSLRAAFTHYGLDLDLSVPVKEYSQPQRDLLFYGVESPIFRRHFPKVKSPTTVRQGRFEGIATNLLRRFSEHIQEPDYREKISEFVITQTCPACDGTRLRPESRSVTIQGRNIVEITRISLNDLHAWLGRLRSTLEGDKWLIAKPLLDELNDRISRLIEVGAGYLTQERSSPTLSAGEAQRLRLAALLGSGLSGVLYVFDEPTIGLHQRDTRRLINVLRGLRDLGNTVLVIEHDMEMIAAADYIVDFGPGGGKHGGNIVAAGTPLEVSETTGSITGEYLSRRVRLPIPSRRRTPGQKAITIHGARRNNLQNITVRLPLDLFVAVTGVSGSGKSTLIFETLDPALRSRLQNSKEQAVEFDALEGWESIQRVITIGQAHVGRLPRSNTATYSDIFTPIREAFAASSEARRRNFSARHFSFNVPGGRCERCEGAGTLAVKMHFLPDVEVQCPACHGRRFSREVLEVKYQGHNISEVLDMTVDDALQLFSGIPSARSRLQVLSDVGLGYLQLGQPATTLSGGEAQRVKLAKELGRRTSGHTLYLLDEPTVGLHLADTARLLGVLNRLVDAGNTVLVIEHNLELIKSVDWVIDLGPEGGSAGGKKIAEGTPEQLSQVSESYTGRYLSELL